MLGHELFSYSELRDPVRHYKKPSGKPVREIKVEPINTKNEFNYLMMYWVVSRYRINEYRRTVLQDKRNGKLSPYAQSLFDSCFKNW